MVTIFLFILFYSFVGGIYYAITDDSEEAFLWVIFIPWNFGKFIVNIFKGK